MTRTILVIDVQNEYFPGGALPLWQPEEAEARIVTAIGQARAAGDKVVLVQHVGKADARLFAAGSPGAAIRPAISRRPGTRPLSPNNSPMRSRTRSSRLISLIRRSC